MRRSALHAYVGAVAALAGGAFVLAAVFTEGVLGERPWLVVALAAAITVEHLFSTRVAHDRREGETTTHEESYLIAGAFLLAPVGVLTVFAVGFAGGNVLLRRPPLKTVFNVVSMVVAAAAAVAVIAAIGGVDDLTPRAVAAVAAGAAAFTLVNRMLMAGVLVLAAGASFVATLTDDVRARSLITAANAAVGLLVGVAAAVHLWTLPVGLVALVTLHFAFTGHGRARAERQKLANIVAAASDAIVTVDGDRRVRSWNPACEEITGYGAERVVGLPIGEVSALLEAEREPRDGDGADAAGAPARGAWTARIRTAAGERRWVRVSRAPLPEGGYVLVIHDETTRRHVDEIRAQQEREEFRSDFVATVSHELRTPLTSILGFAQTLLQHPVDASQQQRYLSIIVAESERLKRLIDDLLDLRQAALGGLAFDLERVDVVSTIAEEVDLFAAKSDAHVVTLNRPDTPLWVRADSQRLRQVVANLLSNAVKYSPGGGEVRVSAAATNGRVRVTVRDRGLGIPADQHGDIFTRFFRVRSPATKSIGGTGLGLALSRAIVDRTAARWGSRAWRAKGRRSTSSSQPIWHTVGEPAAHARTRGDGW